MTISLVVVRLLKVSCFIFLAHCLRIESTYARKLIYALALPGESHAKTCSRNLGLPVPKSYIYPVSWNFAALEAVSLSLNRSVTSSSRYGLKGCCSPGMWCDQSGCFTHSYGTFANYGWLNANIYSVPVFSCFLELKVLAPLISSAIYNDGSLTLAATNILGDVGVTSISIGTESCDFLQVCNSHQCKACAVDNPCPVDSLCLFDQGISRCYMYCGGSSDAACPCGSFCDTVVIGYDSNRKISVSLCTYEYFFSYTGSTCIPDNDSETLIKCESPRTSQRTTTIATSVVSLTVATGVQFLPATKPENLPPRPWCRFDFDCFDGSICTSDTCENGFCKYTSIEGCDSIPQSVRERTAPYVYNMYSQQLVASQQKSFESQMERMGNIHHVTPLSNRIIATAALPFDFVYFGSTVLSISVMTSGAISLPPVPVGDCSVNSKIASCITFSTLSNTIAPLFSSYVFTQASLSSVILLSQTKGDKSLISNIDADAYHILFQRFKNSSDISLQGSGSTFSVSIYMDGSIRFRYHTISLKTLNYVLDYAGLWGSRISDADSAYLRYHNESIPSSLIVANGGGNDIVFCSIPNVIACVVESCVSPSKPLLLIWGSGLPPTCAASAQPVVSCVWAGLVTTTPSYITPDSTQRIRAGKGNYTQLLLCPVPLLNFTDGTVLTVSIIVSAGDSIPSLIPVQTSATDSRTTYGVSIGKSGELARTVLMVRYYTPTSSSFPTKCGCNALPTFPSQTCDANAICGGMGKTEGVLDCNRDPFGNAHVDSCGTCSGGKTRKVPSILCNPTTVSLRCPYGNYPGTTVFFSSPSGDALLLLYKIIIGVSAIVSLSCLLSALLYVLKWYIRGQPDASTDGPSLRARQNSAVDPGLSHSELLAIGEKIYCISKFNPSEVDSSSSRIIPRTYSLIQTGKITETRIEEGQCKIEHKSNKDVDGERRGGNEGQKEGEGEGEVSLPECSICLMDVNIGDNCRILPYCHHLFHSVCVEAWFKCSVCCPLCKRSMREILNGNSNTAAASFPENSLTILSNPIPFNISAAGPIEQNQIHPTTINSGTVPVSITAPTFDSNHITNPSTSDGRNQIYFRFPLLRTATYASPTASSSSVSTGISTGSSMINLTSRGGFGTNDGNRDGEEDRDRDRSVQVRRNTSNHLDVYSSAISDSTSFFPVASQEIDSLDNHSERESINLYTTNKTNVNSLDVSVHDTARNSAETIQRHIGGPEFPAVPITENVNSILYVQRAVDPLSTSRSIYTGNHEEGSSMNVELPLVDNQRDRNKLFSYRT